MIYLTKRQREHIQTRIRNGTIVLNEMWRTMSAPPGKKEFTGPDYTQLSFNQSHWYQRGAIDALQFLLDSTGTVPDEVERLYEETTR